MFICWISVSGLLEQHETEFFAVVNARFSLMRLKRKGVITEDIEARINAATNEDDAQEILFSHLTRNANKDTLIKYCEVVIAANRFPNMQALGKKMMEKLEQGGWLN